MGGASSQTVLCYRQYRVSAQHDVILTWAKETLWLAAMAAFFFTRSDRSDRSDKSAKKNASHHSDWTLLFGHAHTTHNAVNYINVYVNIYYIIFYIILYYYIYFVKNWQHNQ